MIRPQACVHGGRKQHGEQNGEHGGRSRTRPMRGKVGSEFET